MRNRIRFFGGIILMLIIPLTAQSQRSLQERADELFEHLAYHEAIPKYEQIIKQDQTNVQVLIRLADCYRLTNDFDKAAKAYSKVILCREAQPIHTFYYAQALMAISDYPNAKIFMEKYQADERGKTFTESLSDTSKFSTNREKYKTEKVLFNSEFNDYSPSIWKDNSIVFTSSRPRTNAVGYYNAWNGQKYDRLYITKKKSNGKYSKPRLFAETVQSRYNNASSCFNNDRSKVYFTRNNIIDNEDLRSSSDNCVKLKIFEASCIRNESFGDIKEFLYNSIEYNCAHPALSYSGSTLYFASDMAGGFGGMDIWVSHKVNNTWEKPVNMGSLVNTCGNEVFPYVTKEGLLFFASNGLKGLGGLDIFQVSLDSGGLISGQVANIGKPINTQNDDFGIVFAHDGMSGYYSSNFGTGESDDNIFSFTILKPVKQIVTIKGVVSDSKTEELLDTAVVTLKDKDGTVIIAETVTNGNGEFTFDVEAGNEYKVTVVKADFYGDSSSVSTHVPKDVSEVSTNLQLNRIPAVPLRVAITDYDTKLPLADVKIDITDKRTGKVFSGSTSQQGEWRNTHFEIKVGESLNYEFIFSKENYLTKTLPFSYVVSNANEIIINETIGKPELGVEVGEMINLETIYFDYNKWNIRPDAATQLDRVVEAMLEYPDVVIELNSYTDCRGGDEENLLLSKRRAESSASYIISRGVAAGRIIGIGYGESDPIKDCNCWDCSEEDHQLNRRTEFVIVKK